MTFSNIITKITPLIHVTTDLIYKGIMTKEFAACIIKTPYGYNRPDLQRDYDQFHFLLSIYSFSFPLQQT